MNLSYLEKRTKKELIEEILRLQTQPVHNEVIQALEQSNAALQDLFDNSNDLIFVCDIRGYFLFVNRTCSEKIGYSREEFKHIQLQDIIHSSYKLKTYEQFNRMMSGEALNKFETVFLTKSGQSIYLSGRLSIRYEGLEPVAIRGIMYDTTDKIRIETQLISQTARLKAIFESGSHIMWTVNRQRQFTSFNQNYINAIRAQYGFTPQTHTSLHHLRNELEKEGLAKFWKEKFRKAFEGEHQHFEVIARDIHQRTIWQEVYLNPIPSASGEIEEVSAIAHNITAKKMAELALKESEEKFRSIFESFQDIYYKSDMKGHIQMISPSIKELGGYEPHEMLGRRVEEFYVTPLKRSHEARSVLKELMRNGKIKNLEIGLRCKDGAVVESISNIRLMYDEAGKPTAIEGVIRDITELKNASEEVLRAKEIAEKSLKVKESFLANMSHEIRTPMNGIIGMIDLLAATSLDNTQQEYVGTIRKSSETLMDILNDILDLSKIEAGKMVLQPRPIVLENTIQKILHLFSPHASQKSNQLSYQVSPQVPSIILADETRLLQILANLTSNAIKFTEKGQIHIEVTLLKNNPSKPLGSGELFLKVSVKDTGIGIEKEDIDRLFESFIQIDNSFSKPYTGTGLGLAISRQLTTMMGGTIGVKSKKNKGSEFFFTFRTQKAEVVMLPQEASNHQTPIISLPNHPKILVVDDNQINRRVASEVLKKAGALVYVATSGKEAIQMVQQQNFEVILMDIQMPEMDGLEAMRQIRALQVPGSLPPIVAMTAYAMAEDRQKLLEQGMDDYVPKPIQAQALIEKVYHVIQNQASMKAPALDTSVLENLRSLAGTEVVLQSLEELEYDTLKQLKKSKRLLQFNDFTGLLRWLHTLKGNAGTLGALELSQTAQVLEQMLRKPDFDKPALRNLLKQLQINFQEFQKAKEAYIAMHYS